MNLNDTSQNPCFFCSSRSFVSRDHSKSSIGGTLVQVLEVLRSQVSMVFEGGNTQLQGSVSYISKVGESLGGYISVWALAMEWKCIIIVTKAAIRCYTAIRANRSWYQALVCSCCGFAYFPVFELMGCCAQAESRMWKFSPSGYGVPGQGWWNSDEGLRPILLIVYFLLASPFSAGVKLSTEGHHLYMKVLSRIQPPRLDAIALPLEGNQYLGLQPS